RCHLRALPGSPDIAFTKWTLAVFVDGAFWHGHPDFHWPGRVGPYWDEKIARNIARDRRVDEELQSSGWEILRIWDFEIHADVGAQVERVASMLRSRGADAVWRMR